MRRVVLDTNVLIQFLRTPERFVDVLGAYDQIVLAPVVVGEYRAGITQTRVGEENLRALEEFMDNPAVEEFSMTSDTGVAYAKIYRQLRQHGTPIPTNDMWIASVAMECGCALFTRDAHFRNIDGLILA